MRLTPLNLLFGVEARDVDLRTLTGASGYAEIRAAFEEHSLLLFRSQRLDDAAHLSFGSLSGPIEDRSEGKNGPSPRMANVTNVKADSTIATEDDLHTLNLKANQLWHTDSIFLPVPALANILAARELSSRGGETEFVSTRVAREEMPEELKSKLRHAVLRHRYSHSRKKLSADLARQATFTKWPDQTWRAIWPNPVNGKEALYIASHTCGVEGLPEEQGLAVIKEAIAFATRPGTIYTHV
jgi:alpha-ketoglutarate-dependent 2,4-dichlorophenoxyacetate dioxygenase